MRKPYCCSVCGEVGHNRLRHDTAEKREARVRQNRDNKCSICGEVGCRSTRHKGWSGHCTVCGKLDCRATRHTGWSGRCSICGKVGCRKDRHGTPTPPRCSLCGELGHKRSFHASAPITRKCLGCEQTLPISDFKQEEHTRPDGIKYTSTRRYCKPCFLKRRRRQRLCKEHWFRILFSGAKNSAVKRKHKEFDITKEYLYELLENQNDACYYTGRPFQYDTGPFKPSLDRVDNTKGYIVGNVCLCCWYVNQMKRDLPLDLFLETCGQIAQRHQTAPE